MIQKAVNAKAKAGLKSSTMVRDSDIYCLWGHRPSHNTSLKVQTQETTAKKLYTKESRPKKMKLINGKTFAPSRSDESVKLNHIKKKRKWLKKKKNSILATGNNAIESKKKLTPGDTSQVTYYNC